MDEKEKKVFDDFHRDYPWSESIAVKRLGKLPFCERDHTIKRDGDFYLLIFKSEEV
jgi:hypothetical protein